MKLKPIQEQVVAVIGASSGIGRETALRFAKRGARVVVSGRTEASLQSLVEEIRREGGEALPAPADVTDITQLRVVAERAVERFGRLDTWVHASAVYMTARFDETTPEEWRRVIDVNLNGQAYGAMAALPHLKREGRGALIHITSVEAEVALPYQSAYVASKHGAEGLLDALRLELKHDGLPISVTNIRPASINTPLFDKAQTKIGAKPQGIRPIYRPADVATAILYAAEHPVRDVTVGGAGKFFEIVHRISPRLTDAYLLRMGFEQQLSGEPKSVADPDNLFRHLPGFERVEGDYGDQARNSTYTWLTVHPKVRRLLAGAVVGGAALALARGRKMAA